MAFIMKVLVFIGNLMPMPSTNLLHGVCQKVRVFDCRKPNADEIFVHVSWRGIEDR